MRETVTSPSRKEDTNMARKWYGSLNNRIEEGHQFCDEIKVGTGVTEYSWSDRRAFEVIEVYNQKHFRMREYDHRHVGDGCMDNNWELISNPENAEYEVVKRGDTWYYTNTITADDIKDRADDMDLRLRVVLAGFDWDKIMEKGKQTKRWKANISVGVASYYYDYEF